MAAAGMLAVLLITAACRTGDGDDEVSSPAATTSPTPVAVADAGTGDSTGQRPAAAAPPAPARLIMHTGGDGVAVRDDCRDDARVSAPGAGIAEGAAVHVTGPRRRLSGLGPRLRPRRA